MDVDRLASIAQQLAGRVRDDAPDANARWLHAVTSPEEREALLYVLAAAVPVDVAWRHLTAWTDAKRAVQPCGTPAAATRHRYRKEPLCQLCVDAERARDRGRKRESRAA